jgi:hypothetical protein
METASSARHKSAEVIDIQWKIDDCAECRAISLAVIFIMVDSK